MIDQLANETVKMESPFQYCIFRLHDSHFRISEVRPLATLEKSSHKPF